MLTVTSAYYEWISNFCDLLSRSVLRAKLRDKCALKQAKKGPLRGHFSLFNCKLNDRYLPAIRTQFKNMLPTCVQLYRKRLPLGP